VALSSQTSWGDYDDHMFNNQVFYDQVLQVLQSESPWVQDLIKWFNQLSIYFFVDCFSKGNTDSYPI
jgi:hypothetical protein